MKVTNVVRAFAVADQVALVTGEIRAAGQLPGWVIFWNTSDFPGEHVARLFAMSAAGNEATPYLLKCPRTDRTGLEQFRTIFADMGLTPISRNPSDDPVIVETWL